MVGGKAMGGVFIFLIFLLIFPLLIFPLLIFPAGTPYELASRSPVKTASQAPSQTPISNAFDMLLREKAAVRAIIAIHIGQAYYYSQHGEYAGSLAALGRPEQKQGYKFTLVATPDGYTINADPLVFGTSGSRTFYSDQTRTIHSNPGREPATETSPTFK